MQSIVRETSLMSRQGERGPHRHAKITSVRLGEKRWIQVGRINVTRGF